MKNLTFPIFVFLMLGLTQTGLAKEKIIQTSAWTKINLFAKSKKTKIKQKKSNWGHTKEQNQTNISNTVYLKIPEETT